MMIEIDPGAALAETIVQHGCHDVMELMDQQLVLAAKLLASAAEMDRRIAALSWPISGTAN